MKNKIRTSNEGLGIANDIAKKFLKEHYGLDMDINIVENKRLKRSYGRFVIRINRRTNNETLKIDLCPITVKYATIDTLTDTVKHECIHYALYKLCRGYKDGCEDFENELKKHLVTSNYNKNNNNIKEVKYKAIFKCKKCSKLLGTDLLNVTNKVMKERVSVCCKSDIEFVERYVFNGEEKISLTRTQKI